MDRQGKFEFHPSVAGVYEVRLNVFGFVPETQEADLRTMRSALLTFTLKPDPSRKEAPIPPGGPAATIAAPLDPTPQTMRVKIWKAAATFSLAAKTSTRASRCSRKPSRAIRNTPRPTC